MSHTFVPSDAAHLVDFVDPELVSFDDLANPVFNGAFTPLEFLLVFEQCSAEDQAALAADCL